MRKLVLVALAALLWVAPANAKELLGALGDGNVAVVSTAGERDDVVRAIQHLTRPGSP